MRERLVSAGRREAGAIPLRHYPSPAVWATKFGDFLGLAFVQNTGRHAARGWWSCRLRVRAH